MDHRKQFRFEIFLAVIAIVLGLACLWLYKQVQKEEVIIASYSDLYEDPYEDQIFEIIPSAEVFDAQAKKIEFVNIHCTASTRDLSKEWLLGFFKYTRKWSKPGYNLIVHMDGSVDTLVPYDLNGYVEWNEVSYGVKGRNSVSINVAYCGGIDKYGNPLDTRTKAQKNSLVYIVEKLRCEFPGIQVVGHREHNGVSKACPSFDASSEYGTALSPDYELFDSPEDSL